MEKLSPRQKQIYEMKITGQTEREIARSLGIGYHTVKSYARKARQRTGRTTVEIAVAVALDQFAG